MKFQPHPYALMLPALTEDEYRALKADIKQNGILYPVILDEDDRVLDGVHRVRIAGELGIDPPALRHEGLTDERKLHLAVGLNMRRRHLDSDRRRELVRCLHVEKKLSVRKIADVTGWSKSTVDRDLKTSPFEDAAKALRASLDGEALAALRESVPPAAEALAMATTALADITAWEDEQWKRGAWPPSLAMHIRARMHTLLGFQNLRTTTDAIRAYLHDEPEEGDTVVARMSNLDRLFTWVAEVDDEELEAEAARKGLVQDGDHLVWLEPPTKWVSMEEAVATFDADPSLRFLPRAIAGVPSGTAKGKRAAA